jgi:flagellar protein FlaG
MNEVTNKVSVSIVTATQSRSVQQSQKNQPDSSVGTMETVRKGAAVNGNSLPFETQEAKQEATMQQVSQAVSDLNEYVQTVGRDLQFSIDEASGRTVIKVLDSESKDMIRQIPAEEVLVLARQLKEAEGLESTGVELEA